MIPEYAIVENACARAVTCVRALGDGCVTPDPEVNTRAEDSRVEDQGSLSFAGSEAFLRPLSRLSSLATSCQPRIFLPT